MINIRPLSQSENLSLAPLLYIGRFYRYTSLVRTRISSAHDILSIINNKWYGTAAIHTELGAATKLGEPDSYETKCIQTEIETRIKYDSRSRMRWLEVSYREVVFKWRIIYTIEANVDRFPHLISRRLLLYHTKSKYCTYSCTGKTHIDS